MHRRMILAVCAGVGVGVVMAGAGVAASRHADAPWDRVTTAPSVPSPDVSKQTLDEQPLADPPTADEAPLTIGLMTISGDLSYFAGQRVHIQAARVRDVISPRVFSIEPANMPRSGMRDNGRALVVLASPGAPLQKDTVVEIIGRPWTLVGAKAHLNPAWMDELDEDDVDRFEHKPIIAAEVVQPPGSAAILVGR